MVTTWPTHEEAVPKMPCGRRKLNASCKRTRYRLISANHILPAVTHVSSAYKLIQYDTTGSPNSLGQAYIIRLLREVRLRSNSVNNEGSKP